MPTSGLEKPAQIQESSILSPGSQWCREPQGENPVMQVVLKAVFGCDYGASVTCQ